MTLFTRVGEVDFDIIAILRKLCLVQIVCPHRIVYFLGERTDLRCIRDACKFLKFLPMSTF